MNSTRSIAHSSGQVRVGSSETHGLGRLLVDDVRPRLRPPSDDSFSMGGPHSVLGVRMSHSSAAVLRTRYLASWDPK